MSSRPSLYPGFTTREMESVFSPEATVAAVLEFEAALAMALADIGIAPESATQAVAEACARPVSDADAVLASTWETGTPLLALRSEITGRLSEDEARWFHFGATTQDAIDTGLMLQSRRGLRVIDGDLIAVARTLRNLTVEFRDQTQMGRTFLQDARPTTFGLRTAGWLNTVLDHHDDMQTRIESLQVQLGGSNGTRSDYEENGTAVVNALAERLDLAASPLVWHVDRAGIRALVQSLDRLAATMAKIATDIALLSSLGEVTVRSGGSSAMPEKRNPIDSMRTIAAASAASGAVAMITGAPPLELDRGLGGWHVEWLAVPLTFRTTAAAVDGVRLCVESLEVDRTVMSSRVEGGDFGVGVRDQIEMALARANSALS